MIMKKLHQVMVKEAFANLNCVVSDNLAAHIGENGKVDATAFRIALDAYNRYQEDECDGCDYVFNISNQDDLSVLVKCGTTAQEIADMVATGFTMFHVGYNYPKPQPLSQMDVCRAIIGISDALTNTAMLLQNQSSDYSKFLDFFLYDEVMKETDLYALLTKQ